MAWESQGLLLTAPLPLTWAVSHAALPHVVGGADGSPELYFSCRDARGRSLIGSGRLDVERGDVRLGKAPVLEPGPLGAFDDNGVTTSCLVRDGERELLYYTGWSLGETVPFYLFVGCAVRDGAREFRRVSAAPLLERSDVDPFLTASPWVLLDGDRWRMWYVSATSWELVDGAPRHRYHIKYAESPDGLTWGRDGVVCIDFADESEYAMSRPCVVRDADVYRMWFSSRGEAYRICYAESTDGIEWRRIDRGVVESSGEWDAEMQAYPAVFDHEGTRYLLYNGNGYGETGVGWAVWTSSS